MTSEPVVLYEVNHRVAVVTLNRPAQMNAITPELRIQLVEQMARASKDPAARAIVLTGAGRAFSAGMDMDYLKNRSAGAARAQTPAIDELLVQAMPASVAPDLGDEFLEPHKFAYLMRIGKPVIAALNGPVVGISCVLALCADIRFASDRMFLLTAMSQRGLIAEHAVQWLMTRLIGPSRSLDLLLSSRRVEADEAKTIGLVSDVFPHDQFIERVMHYARNLAENISPRSMAVIKAQVWKSMLQDYREALATSDNEVEPAFSHPDFREGVSHFAERRAAKFSDL